MKSFKIKVDDKEVKFIEELLSKFDFVQFEQVDSINEPRVYPAADFEIRSMKTPNKKVEENQQEERAIDKDEQGKVDAMSDLRNAISRIDKLRDHSK